MAISTEQHARTVKAAFTEGYEACFKARARAAAGFDTKDADEAWRASEAYRRLTQTDGEG